jgi:hypothetical protein
MSEAIEAAAETAVAEIHAEQAAVAAEAAVEAAHAVEALAEARVAEAVIEAEAEVAEVVETVQTQEQRIEWLTNTMQAMAAQQATILEQQTAILAALTMSIPQQPILAEAREEAAAVAEEITEAHDQAQEGPREGEDSEQAPNPEKRLRHRPRL